MQGCMIYQEYLDTSTGNKWHCLPGNGPNGTWTANANPSSVNSIIFVDGVTYPKTQAGLVNAIAAACTGTGGHLILPPGTITLTSNLNLTGLTGCTIEGAASYATSPGVTSYVGTVLQINFTGGTTVGVDISGDVSMVFKNLVFSCGTSTANAPNTCFLHGRTSGSNGIQNVFDHVYIAGFSPWIYYNYHGEQASFVNNSAIIEYATTGTPITLSVANTAGNTSPNVTFGGVNSETEFFFEDGMTVSSQATAAGSKLIYLDEGSGTVSDVRFRGFANTSAANEQVIGDTTGATGAVTDITLELVAQSGSLSTNTIANPITGNAYRWHVTGEASAGSTAVPFNFAGLFRESQLNFLSGAASGTTCLNVGSDAEGSIIQIGPSTCAGHVTATQALVSVETSGVAIGSPFQITDMGTCTMASGACTAQAFPSSRTYAAAPKIWLQWTGTGTCTGLLKYTDTTTTVTPASSVGTDTCQVNWFAFGASTN